MNKSLPLLLTVALAGTLAAAAPDLANSELYAGRRDGLRVQSFRDARGRRAAIYWSRSTGVRELYGVIMKRYAGFGAELSRLRLPSSYPFPIAGGLAQEFQGGVISWNASLNKTTVTYW